MHKNNRETEIAGGNQGIISHALSSATDRPADKTIQELRLHLSKKEETKLTWLCALLGGSVSYITNAAIRYALFVSKKTKTKVEKVKGFPKRDGSAASFEATLTLDTLARIKGSEIGDDRLAKCAILGVNLLFEKLK